MDNNTKTDREILAKGLKQMGICLLLMFVGPTLFHLALNNNDKPLYLLLLIISIILCILAIALLFIGINTIVKSMFKKK